MIKGFLWLRVINDYDKVIDKIKKDQLSLPAYFKKVFLRGEF